MLFKKKEAKNGTFLFCPHSMATKMRNNGRHLISFELNTPNCLSAIWVLRVLKVYLNDTPHCVTNNLNMGTLDDIAQQNLLKSYIIYFSFTVDSSVYLQQTVHLQ